MSWLSFAGIAGVVFFICFLGWFSLHPISRDRVLLKFGWNYFFLLLLIVFSSIFVIAGLLELIPVIGKPKFFSNLNLEGIKSLSNAAKYCTKMGEPEESNILLSFLVMLFQIVVFEGLIVAAIVGWTGKRTKKIQKGQVRYKQRHLNGTFTSLWDSCLTSKKNSYAVVIGANEVAASVIKNLMRHEEKKQGSLNYAHEEENQYVILQTSSDIEEVRQLLRAYLTQDEYDRVLIYSDLRNSYEGLRELCIEDASEIYILGENTMMDGGEVYHDSMNMRCLNLIAEILKQDKDKKSDSLKNLDRKINVLEYKINQNSKDKDRLQEASQKGLQDWLLGRLIKKRKARQYNDKVCKVLFEYQTTFSVFQFSNITPEISETMVFVPFNRYDSWARRVIADNRAVALIDESSESGIKKEKYVTYTPLDGYEGISYDSNQHVHFIVVGMSKMGIAMGLQAIYQAHYPNYVRDNSLRSRITFIDEHADQEMQFFKGRYSTLFELVRHRYIDANECASSEVNDSAYGWIDPMVDTECKWKHHCENATNFMDIELLFIKGALETEGVREYLTQETQDRCSKVTIAICLPLTPQAIAAALYMPWDLYKTKPDAEDDIKKTYGTHKESYSNVQEIWVYQREAADIITNLAHEKNQNRHYKLFKPFGMLYGEYIDSRTHYLKSLLVNKMYFLEENPLILTELDMGDKESYKDLRVSWKRLTVEAKWSNKYFVDTIYQKMRSVMKGLSPIASIGGYDNIELRKMSNWQMTFESALQNAKGLAECEHNRWNTQQLLLGFRPAEKEIDEKLQQYVKNGVVIEKTKEEYKKYDKYLKNQRKIHCCICDFNHMDLVNPNAKPYDEKLNNGIPKIIAHVDGYMREIWYVMKMHAIATLGHLDWKIDNEK